MWSRLDPGSFAVLTASSHPDAKAFDASQALRVNQIHRIRFPVLLPTPELANKVRELAGLIDARLVVIDPALPLGLFGPRPRACHTRSCSTVPRSLFPDEYRLRAT